MKRAFILAVTAFLVLSILSGIAYALSGDDIVGTWRLTSVVMNDNAYTPEEAGLQIAIVLNTENKALLLKTRKESELMSWSITGDSVITLRNDSDEYLFNYENGNLIEEYDDFKLIFEIIYDSTEIVAKPPVKTDAVIDDFLGSWTAVYIEVNGIFARLADVGVEIMLKINESSIESRERYGNDDVINITAHMMDGYNLVVLNKDGTTPVLFLHENGMIASPSSGNTIWLVNNNGTIEMPPEGQWKCSACGHEENKGNFCIECGAMKPQTTGGWACSCGAANEGKFCTECGLPKPDNTPAAYKCGKCGWEPEDPEKPPKFCPDCGDAFDENDLVR